MKHIHYILSGILALGLSACSKDDNTVSPLEDENSNVFVEFQSELRSYAGTDAAGEAFDSFRLFGVNAATGAGLMGNNPANFVTARRNADDPTMWDYKAVSTKDGGNGLWRWASFKNPVTFWGLSGSKEAMAQYAIGNVNKRPTVKVQLPMAAYEGGSNTARYDSRTACDILFGSALNCSGTQYLADTSKVVMPFVHLLPRIGVRASLGSGDALDITVHEVTLMGLCTAAEYLFCDAQPRWVPFTPTGAADGVATEIVLHNGKPVQLQAALQNLNDAGAEAYVIPQTLQPWASPANPAGGMGLRVSMQVLNKATGDYLVGSASAPDYVYVPARNMQLESGNLYYMDLTFTALYDANGTPTSYQLSYAPTVAPWEETNDNLTEE